MKTLLTWQLFFFLQIISYVIGIQFLPDINLSYLESMESQMIELESEIKNSDKGIDLKPFNSLESSLEVVIEGNGALSAKNGNLRGENDYDAIRDRTGAKASQRGWCQWSQIFYYDLSPALYIDQHAAYYFQIIPELDPESMEAIKFVGKFPKVRYFSVERYIGLRGKDGDKNLDAAHIKPAWGCNPFSDPSCTEENIGGYEIWVTHCKRPGKDTHPLPNEFCFDPEEDAKYLDPVNIGPPKPGQAWYSGVEGDRYSPHLVIRYFQPEDAHVKSQDIETPIVYRGHVGCNDFYELPQCKKENEEYFSWLSNLTEWLEHYRSFKPFPSDCTMTSDKLRIAEGSWMVNAIPAVGGSTSYFFWCNKNLEGRDFWLNNVLVVKYKLPKTPYTGLFPNSEQNPQCRVSETHCWQAQYASITSVDSWIPLMVSETHNDLKILEHYGGKDHPERYYTDCDSPTATIILAESEEKAKRCGFLPNDQGLPDLYGTHDGIYLNMRTTVQNAFPYYAGIIMRQVNSDRNDPTTFGGARERCLNDGEGGMKCGDPDYLRSLMGDYYPELEIYRCLEGAHESGSTPLVYNVADTNERMFEGSHFGSYFNH